ncbi:MAG TPA: hypothetical protein V6C89_21200 [Drouetiella sp.]
MADWKHQSDFSIMRPDAAGPNFAIYIFKALPSTSKIECAFRDRFKDRTGLDMLVTVHNLAVVGLRQNSQHRHQTVYAHRPARANPVFESTP